MWTHSIAVRNRTSKDDFKFEWLKQEWILQGRLCYSLCPKLLLKQEQENAKEYGDIRKRLCRYANNTMFTTAQETQVSDYLKQMELWLFALTTKAVRRLAYHIAGRNQIFHPI